MDKKDCIHLGTIRRTFGYKGELTIFVNSPFGSDLGDIDFLFIDIDKEIVPFYIENLTFRDDNSVLVKFQDIDNADLAKQFVNHELFVSKNDLKSKSDHQLNFMEIIGFDVIDNTHGPVGKVEEIINNGEQYLIRITKEETEILVPFVKEIIFEIDKKGKVVFIDAPVGLIDLNM
ncbi:MAG: 16S rRNA processing protein RimM [Bacteroidales bacterium]|nr:16S rRNA processing protein RimM [Bacteroidales bacterium]